VSTQLIQRAEIHEIRGVVRRRSECELRFIQEVCLDKCGRE
jgi:hypothetical protein